MPDAIARTRVLVGSLIAAVVALGLFTATTTLAATSTGAGALRRVGDAPVLPAGTTLLSALPATTEMHVTVTLKPRDPDALAQLASSVATPGSSDYRQYLTPGEFAQRFGATPAQIAAVEQSLRAHGLVPGAAAVDRLSIPITATAAALSQAFSTVLERVRIAGGQVGVVNSLAPELDDSIAPLVQGVIGLDSLNGEHALSSGRGAGAAGAAAHAEVSPHVVTGGPQPCTAASTAGQSLGSYTADQIASAYDFSGLYKNADEGAGITVALYELEPYDPKDIAAYQSCYGTSVPVSDVTVDGGNGTGAGSGEAALDIEQVIGLAPKAKVIVYNGPNSQSGAPGAGPYDLFAAIVNQDAAQVVSNSWGQCEASEGSADAHAEEALFEQAAAQGQTVLSASGDAGSEDCDAGGLLANTSLAVDDPGSDPFVTSVGGTSMSKPGPPPTETAWNNGGSLTGALGIVPGAGGGGVSSLWTMPVYQSGAPSSLGVIGTGSAGTTCGAASGYCRQVPDVSAEADPEQGYLIYYNGSGTVANTSAGWQATGGTSAAAPLWGALVADADSSAACAGAPIGFLNPALYRAAASAYGTDFHDVTSGNNDFTGAHRGLYPAEPGYDMATGLGSPSAASLAQSLCADSLRVASPGTLTSAVKSKVSYRLGIHDASGQQANVSETGLPVGLRLDPSTGVVTGTPTKAGRYSVHIDASDATGDTQAASFVWVISGRPRVSGLSLRGVRAGKPALSLSVGGSGGPTFTKIAVRMPKGISVSGKVRGLTVTAAGKKVTVKATAAHGVLTLVPAAPAAQLKLTIRAPGITASRKLVAGARRHPRLKLTVATTDPTGQNTLPATVKVAS